MPRIWLIGASSFTGHYVMAALQAAGYQVNSTKVDIRQAAEVEQVMLSIQPDYIINLAAISFVPDGGSSDIYAINTFGAQNILEACLKLAKQPKKIILASSSHIYGEQTQAMINEQCIPNPINHYGCSKWAMEQIAKTYQDKLNILITRPFNYTGRGQAEKFLIPKIVQHFQKKAPSIQLGNIDIWRDFSDVRWVADIYVALLSVPPLKKWQPINLCSSQLMSIREILEVLQQLSGHTLSIEINPKFIRAADMQKQCGDNTILQSLLPQITTENDFQKTLAWMLSTI